MLECSGNASATAQALGALRPGGVLVLVGAGQGSGLDPATILFKEITVHGSFTYVGEFEDAIELLADRQVEVADLTTDVLSLGAALSAIESLRAARTMRALIDPHALPTSRTVWSHVRWVPCTVRRTRRAGSSPARRPGDGASQSRVGYHDKSAISTAASRPSWSRLGRHTPSDDQDVSAVGHTQRLEPRFSARRPKSPGAIASRVGKTVDPNFTVCSPAARR